MAKNEDDLPVHSTDGNIIPTGVDLLEMIMRHVKDLPIIEKSALYLLKVTDTYMRPKGLVIPSKMDSI